MEKSDILATLRLFYAGLLVDSLSQFEHYGLLGKVALQKQQENLLSAPRRIEQFGFRSPAEIFTAHRDIFGFSDWNMESNGSVVEVTNTACKICAIAQVMGTVQPCDVCCINPLNALCGALKEPHSLTVEHTLWTSERCTLLIHPKEKP
jgi:hypothetical protein